MKYKYSFLFFLSSFFFTVYAVGQTTYLPLESEDNYLLDRLETRSGRLSDTLCLTAKAESRSRAIQFINQKKNDTLFKLNHVEKYNIQQLISENGEWAGDTDAAINSKHSLFNTFYKKQYDFFHLNTKELFLVLNPVINLTETHESSQQKNALIKNPMLFNSHYFEVRGRIMSKIGFYTLITDNQEALPSYIANASTGRRSIPGLDYYTYVNSLANRVDYFHASGYFDFALIKNKINVTFGNGKNFIGDGIRSLFLSDASANTPYLKITTRIWKFNYQNLYLELTPQFSKLSERLPHNFATMHHLSINLNKWLNVGVFEAVVFNRPNSYEIDYLNPIILYRYVERYNGSPDNELLGFNFKAIAAHKLQLYGQLMLDEFTAKEFFGGHGYWANKYGIQLGGKIFDALGIKNLDLQAELNCVRPFTYSHNDTVINYTNYNQPLAHPLGSGFIEMLFVARYQPVKNLYFTLKGMHYNKGADTGNINYGNNVFLDYSNHYAERGVPWISGVSTYCNTFGLNVSYQLFRNVFLDLGSVSRDFVASIINTELSSTTGKTFGNSSTTLYYFGIRINAPRRAYDTFF